jgi:hypothetical protein
MNITLSVDEQVVERARKAAQAMGKSLNQVIREHLEQLAGMDAERRKAIAEEFVRLVGTGRGNPEPGWTFDREATHDRAAFRRHEPPAVRRRSA